MLGGADRQRGLDAFHIGRGRQLAGEEFLEALQVLADDLEDEMDEPLDEAAISELNDLDSEEAIGEGEDAANAEVLDIKEKKIYQIVEE